MLLAYHGHSSTEAVQLPRDREDSERESDVINCCLYSLRILQRIPPHLLMLGLLPLCGAKHCKASSRIFSTTMLLAVARSSLGSTTLIASPSANFFIACNTHGLYSRTQPNQINGHFHETISSDIWLFLHQWRWHGLLDIISQGMQ